jgi:hypothetical protein
MFSSLSASLSSASEFHRIRNTSLRSHLFRVSSTFSSKASRFRSRYSLWYQRCCWVSSSIFIINEHSVMPWQSHPPLELRTATIVDRATYRQMLCYHNLTHSVNMKGICVTLLSCVQRAQVLCCSRLVNYFDVIHNL